MITHIMDLHIVWNYQLQKRITAIDEESKCQYSQNDYKTKLPHMENIRAQSRYLKWKISDLTKTYDKVDK